MLCRDEKNRIFSYDIPLRIPQLALIYPWARSPALHEDGKRLEADPRVRHALSKLSLKMTNEITLESLKRIVDEANEEFGGHCSIRHNEELLEFFSIAKTDWNMVEITTPSEELDDHYPPVDYK
jgi:hypothetical protein